MARVVRAKLWKPAPKGSACKSDQDEMKPKVCRQKRFKLMLDNSRNKIPSTCDDRVWTSLHYKAVNIVNRSSCLTHHNEEFDSTAQCKDINSLGPGGLSPLMLAISSKHHGDCDERNDCAVADLVETFIKCGAKIEVHSDIWNETPLHLAARYGRTRAAKHLLDAGADANARDKTGRTALHLAVTADAQGVFKILLRHRATDLDAQCEDGTTPLIYAARFLANNMMEKLIKTGASINKTDKKGKTALHWSAYVGNDEGTSILLRYNAIKNVHDTQGQTPLFLASKEGLASVVKILLSSFTNRHLENDMNQSPLDIAIKEGHEDIVELLSNWPCRSTLTVPRSNQNNSDNNQVTLLSKMLSITSNTQPGGNTQVGGYCNFLKKNQKVYGKKAKHNPNQRKINIIKLSETNISKEEKTKFI